MGAVGYTGGDPSKVDVAGDTMTGPLVLPGDPSLDLQAATKQYVDSHGGGGATGPQGEVGPEGPMGPTGPAGSGSGSTFTLVATTVDFGAGVGFEETFITQFVAAPSVSATPTVLCMVMGSLPDHDAQDAAVEDVHAYVSEVQVGVGFEVAVIAPNGTWGDYTVNCFYIP